MRSTPTPRSAPRPQKEDPDAVIDTLATKQHGLVTRAQLLGAGVSTDVVDRRVQRGRLRIVHRGVYRVGPLTDTYAREMAAVLAFSGDAVVSHASAAALWRLLPRTRASSPVDLIHPRASRRAGIRVHRLGSLATDEATTLRGIPVTTPARTLMDLAVDHPPRELERALSEGLALRIMTLEGVHVLLRRHRRRAGTHVLAGLLESFRGFSRSEAEDRLLALIGKAGLAWPQRNVDVRAGRMRYQVDFLWKRERVVVEVDGFAYHTSPRSFHGDRARDADLTAAGFRVVRVTWRHLSKRPMAVVARVAGALAAGGGGVGG